MTMNWQTVNVTNDNGRNDVMWWKALKKIDGETNGWRN